MVRSDLPEMDCAARSAPGGGLLAVQPGEGVRDPRIGRGAADLGPAGGLLRARVISEPTIIGFGNSQSDDINREGNDERQAHDGGADQYLAHGASVLSRSVNETAVLFVPNRQLKALTVHM